MGRVRGLVRDDRRRTVGHKPNVDRCPKRGRLAQTGITCVCVYVCVAMV